MAFFNGCGAAMVTPFDRDGNIGYSVLERYIEHLINGGVTALFPFGTTGELSTVSKEEFISATRFIIEKTAGRVPVIVGTGSNCTDEAVKRALLAQSLGADGLLVVTPYYNKCTQAGIVAHYKAVTDAVDIPVIAYNVPSRTGVDIQPPTLEKLIGIDGLVGIKEASGDIKHFQRCISVCRDTDLDVYCGDDELAFAELALGAAGMISVAANIVPKRMSKLAKLIKNNDHIAARDIMTSLTDLIDALFCEVNPIPVKKALQMIGLDVGSPRLPLTELEGDHATELEHIITGLGLKI